MKYNIRAEITGEFVTRYAFNNKKEAVKKYNELNNSGVYDNLDIWNA